MCWDDLIQFRITMDVRLTKSFSFDSAHWLPTFPEGHKCRRLHGHTFNIDVIVAGPVDPDKGYLIDFGELKRLIEPLKQQLDHRLLNDIDGLDNPTAENLARWIWQRLEDDLPILDTIIVRETCTSACEYRGE
jgi:6-pyruvoyltetrahydropterin/6-carboxytetrahydropterin synthase